MSDLYRSVSAIPGQVVPSWRTVDVLTDLPPEQRRGAIFSGDLTLIPDTRLQGIADAWNGDNMTMRLARDNLYQAWPLLARVIDIAVGEGLIALVEEEQS